LPHSSVTRVQRGDENPFPAAGIAVKKLA